MGSAPIWHFQQYTCITKTRATFLDLRNIQFEEYIDNCFLNHQNMATLILHRDFTHQLGWIFNMQKSELMPSFNLQLIGGLFQTNLDLLFVQGPSKE